MKCLWVLYLLMFSVAAETHSAGAVIVVANINSHELTLKKQDVRAIFMGAPIGRDLIPAALKPKHSARILFNTKVLGLTESRIQSFWAQMKFSGKSKPPIEFESTQELIDYLLLHSNAIGYLPSDTVLPQQLTVVYSVE